MIKNLTNVARFKNNVGALGFLPSCTLHISKRLKMSERKMHRKNSLLGIEPDACSFLRRNFIHLAKGLLSY